MEGLPTFRALGVARAGPPIIMLPCEGMRLGGVKKGLDWLFSLAEWLNAFALFDEVPCAAGRFLCWYSLKPGGNWV